MKKYYSPLFFITGGATSQRGMGISYKKVLLTPLFHDCWCHLWHGDFLMKKYRLPFFFMTAGAIYGMGISYEKVPLALIFMTGGAIYDMRIS